jgi:signal-transduction protein with cAMP-binding, CBS, and nucleotidyltransferase domain
VLASSPISYIPVAIVCHTSILLKKTNGGSNMLTAEAMVKHKGGTIISVVPNTTVYEALRKMLENKIGAILVEENGRYVGIWTERDLMRNSIDADFNPRTAKVSDCMTEGVKTAPHSDTAYQLVDKFLGLRLRHLVIEKNGEPIGMLSVGDVVKARLNEKMKEVEDLKSIVTWDYYENWRWEKKK